MNLKLNIYKKREIIKTYESDTYDLLFGTVEDFLGLIDLDKIKTGSDAEIIKLVGQACIGGMDTIKSLLKDVFEDLTDEDLKNTRVSEIVKVLTQIIRYSIMGITKGKDGKN